MDALDIELGELLSNTGNSEGAKKGWETRRGGGADDSLPPGRTFTATETYPGTFEGEVDGSKFSMRPARYAKGQVAISVEGKSGYKTRGAYLMGPLNARYSGREHAYILSPSKAAVWKALAARGYDGGSFGDTIHHTADMTKKFKVTRSGLKDKEAENSILGTALRRSLAGDNDALGNRAQEPFYKLFNCECGCGKCPEAVAEEAAKKKAEDEKIVNVEEIENGGYRSVMSAMRNSKACGGSHISDDKECRLEGANPGEIGSKVNNFLTSNGVKPSWASSAMGYIHRVLSGNNQFIKSASNPKVVVKNGYAAKFTMDAVAVKPDGSEAKGKVSYTFTPNRGIAHKVSFTPDSELSNSRLGSLSCDTVIKPEDEIKNSQPCGDSHIPDGHQCHVGGGASPEVERTPIVDKASAAEQKAEERYIATTVLEQIRATDRSALMAWGMQRPTIMPAGKVGEDGYQRGGIQFKVNGGKLGHGVVKVRLMANDTYTVETGKVRMGQWKQQGKRDEVYADSLMETIDHMVERDRPGYSNRYHAALEAMVNSKPCGDSHIPDGSTCHIGQALGIADSGDGLYQKSGLSERGASGLTWKADKHLKGLGFKAVHHGPDTEPGGVSLYKSQTHAAAITTNGFGDDRRWKLKISRRDGGDTALVNADNGGQPCGGSHIAAGLTCHAGGARPSMTPKQAFERGVVTRHRDHTGTFHQADGQGEKRFKTVGEALAAHDDWRRKKEAASKSDGGAAFRASRDARLAQQVHDDKDRETFE